MVEIPVQLQTFYPHRFLRSSIILCIFASCILAGCSIRKRPSVPWATAVLARPVQQPQDIEMEIPQDQVPVLRMELPTFPPRLVGMRSAPLPPRPQVAAPPPSTAGGDVEKAEAPAITPQLTPQEAAMAQQQTNQSLGIAERNLASVHGKSLNAAQSDLVSKILGFIKDARDAAQAGDWSRARSLAKKAEVLSVELVG